MVIIIGYTLVEIYARITIGDGVHLKCFLKLMTPILNITIWEFIFIHAERILIIMRKYIYIGLGGFLGAMLRMFIKNIDISSFNGLFPINTLIVNVFGSFLIALFLTVSIEVLEIEPDIRIGIATGFFGAFTTFSTVCKEVVTIFEHGYYLNAISYAFISIFLGLAAVYMGIIIARGIIRKFVNHYKASSIENDIDNLK